MKVKKWVFEIIRWSVVMFVLTNIISYLRKPEPVSTQLPEITVSLIDGSRYTIQKGKPIIIHFWATWCPVCKLEAGNIDHLSKTYEVLTVAVNSGEDAVIKSYLNKQALSFRVLNDKTGKWSKFFNVSVFPSTFIYDRNGMLKFTEVGYTTTAGLMARMTLLK